jgi:hypothetical protein
VCSSKKAGVKKNSGSENFSTGPEYRNEGNKICWTQN